MKVIRVEYSSSVEINFLKIKEQLADGFNQLKFLCDKPFTNNNISALMGSILHNRFVEESKEERPENYFDFLVKEQKKNPNPEFYLAVDRIKIQLRGLGLAALCLKKKTMLFPVLKRQFIKYLGNFYY